VKIEFIGNEQGITGYATHVRELKKALKDNGVEITTGESVNTPCVAITMPDYWTMRSGNRHKPFLPFLVYEGTKLPANWIKQCNSDYVTAILVPSNYVKEMAISNGINKPIHIISHGFNPEKYNKKIEVFDRLKDDDSFKFLMVGGWAQGIKDRKGFQYALKAYKEVFNKKDKVNLVFKINMNYNPKLNINRELAKLGYDDNTEVKITYIPDNLTDDEMVSLYKTCDCLIAPSMSEAFNLPVLESLAVGTPVIVTNYGGPLDFVNEKNGWLVSVEDMVKSEGLPHYLYEDTLWAKPCVKDLGEKMRIAFDNKKLLKKKSKACVKSVKNFTWDKSAKELIKVLKSYGVEK